MATTSRVRGYAALLVLSLLLAPTAGPGPVGVLDAQDRPLRAMVLTGQNPTINQNTIGISHFWTAPPHNL